MVELVVQGRIGRHWATVDLRPRGFCMRRDAGGCIDEGEDTVTREETRSGAQTFDCFLQQQEDGTLVVDQHARRVVLIENDVRHSHVLLQRH